MSTYQVKDHILRRHASLRGAYVYAPVADFPTEDVVDVSAAGAVAVRQAYNHGREAAVPATRPRASARS